METAAGVRVLRQAMNGIVGVRQGTVTAPIGDGQQEVRISFFASFYCHDD
jgi:hypothetical protein